jgi:rhodanese-related sulfurtransferase
MIRHLYTLLLTAVIAGPISSCGQAGQTGPALAPQEYQAKLKAEPEAQLVDVRTPQEYNEVHLPRAQNLNYYSEDFKKSAELLDKTKPVYVYCRSGARSAKVATLLRKSGFAQVYDLKGGILAWTDNGLPTTTERLE